MDTLWLPVYGSRACFFTAKPSILWTVHLMLFYALTVYSGPPRPHDDLAPTAMLFVVAYVMNVSNRHFPGLWGRCPSFIQRLPGAGVVCTTNVIGTLGS
jgi:hypothetical protein